MSSIDKLLLYLKCIEYIEMSLIIWKLYIIGTYFCHVVLLIPIHKIRLNHVVINEIMLLCFNTLIY